MVCLDIGKCWTGTARCFVAALVIGLAMLSPANAATYYVDSETGRDAWSGLQQAPVGSPAQDGPWQTLARVRSATLLPGDQVRLRCGRVWTESLRIEQSGTASTPIVIGPYPSGCTPAPLIEGAVAVPSHAWTLDSGRVYRARLPLNLVENGSLDRSVTKWTQFSAVGDATVSYRATCPAISTGCLALTTASVSPSLAISPNFPVRTGVRYRVRYSVLAPAGVAWSGIVRRGGPTFEVLGYFQNFIGNGAWQTGSGEFIVPANATNARFDLHVAGVRQQVLLRDVAVEPILRNPTFVYSGTGAITEAHHPNAGHLASDPGSMYLRNAVDANQVTTATGVGSTYLTTGSDLRLPAGATLTPGISAHVRAATWSLDSRRVTAVAGTRLTLESPTSYRFLANWGYFLTGAKWMLDSPDEWYFDPSSSTLFVWMPDGGHPEGRVLLSTLDRGIDLSGRMHVVVEGIAVRGTAVGASLQGATRVTLRHFRIEDTEMEAVDAKGSVFAVVERGTILRSGLDAIDGTGAGFRDANQMLVQGVTINESGVIYLGNSIVSIPVPLKAAINPGTAATVTGNTIRRSGFIGVRVYGAGQITRNSVSETCTVLDDCGGIYASFSSSGTGIANNLVFDIRGATSGTPVAETRAVGIYLDERARDVVVEGNAIANADHGIQVHNAHWNTIRNNVFYGNRRIQLWFQEQSRLTRTDGDIYSNSVVGNTFFPTIGSPSVVQESYLGSVSDFAGFSSNVYSALLSPRIVSELTPSSSVSYTLPEWQAATANGVSRQLDAQGRVVTAAGYAAFSSTGGSIVPNGDISQGLLGWTRWGQLAPLGTLTSEYCAGYGNCLRLSAGASATLMASPNFSVVKDQWYRVSFDARVGQQSQPFSVLVRRGGGGSAGYEPLMPSAEGYRGNTGWTRYSFTFKALRSVNAGDPQTQELGARVDFLGTQPGQSLWVGYVEMVPLSPVEVGLKTALLRNESPTAASVVDCPTRNSDPVACSQFVRFRDGAIMTWPYALNPLSTEIVFTQNRALLDSDGDGVPDAQDRCVATTLGQSVRANGCALSQTAP